MALSEPGGHLDHMLRQTRMHHAQLSSMADVKANMLLTMASVVLTLGLPQLVEGQSMIPLATVCAFCLVTIVLAAWATMPKTPLRAHPKTTDPHGRNFNLLFFGDFVHLDSETFEAEMESMMKDPEMTYRAQIREIYTLGVFLARKKYRFLKLAYLAFIAGLVLGGTSFVVDRFVTHAST